MRPPRIARPLERRTMLALALASLASGCMVGGLRPPIRQRFRDVVISADALAAALDAADRTHLETTLRLSAADVFRNELRPGDPALPRLDVVLISLTLAETSAPVPALGPAEPARDRLVAEWSLAPAAGGRGPRATVWADRAAHRPGEPIIDPRRDRLDLLCGRLWDAIWNDLRRS